MSCDWTSETRCRFLTRLETELIQWHFVLFPNRKESLVSRQIFPNLWILGKYSAQRFLEFHTFILLCLTSCHAWMDEDDCDLMKPQGRGKSLMCLSLSDYSFPGPSPPEDSTYHPFLVLKPRNRKVLTTYLSLVINKFQFLLHWFFVMAYYCTFCSFLPLFGTLTPQETLEVRVYSIILISILTHK